MIHRFVRTKTAMKIAYETGLKYRTVVDLMNNGWTYTDGKQLSKELGMEFPPSWERRY